MSDISNYEGFFDKPGQLFKYTFSIKTPKNGESTYALFYAFDEESARKQHFDRFGEEPAELIRRENW